MSSFADLEDAIKANQVGIKDLIGLMGKFATSSKKVIKSTDDLTSAQRKLGMSVKEDGKLYNKAGSFINKFGMEVDKAGDTLGNFNKRTAIMNSTVKEFTTQGKAVSFLKGWNTYVKQGGSRLEYMAEYMSSTREELTLFGLEAGKARKFMYGFLPPGMFRMMNKLSSSFQFVGGTLRKLSDNGKGAKDQIEALKAQLGDFPVDSDDLKELKELITELENDSAPTIFSSMVLGFNKFKKLMTEPLVARIDIDGFEHIKKKKLSLTDVLLGKGQLKHRSKRELLQVSAQVTKFRKKWGVRQNFLLTLTPAKKDRLKELKEIIKEKRKFIKNVTPAQKLSSQKAKGVKLGINDDEVVALAESLANVNSQVKITEDRLEKVLKSQAKRVGVKGVDTGALVKRKKLQEELDDLLKEQVKSATALGTASKTYNASLNKAVNLSDIDVNADNVKEALVAEREKIKIEEDSINGTRKRYKDLYDGLNDMRDGFQLVIKAEDTTKQVAALSKELIKAEEHSTKLEDEITQMMKLSNITGSFGDIEGAADYYERAIELEEKLNSKLESREAIQKALTSQLAKGQGTKNLQDQLKIQKDFVKGQEKILKNQDKVIKGALKNKKINEGKIKVLEKEFKRKEKAGEFADMPALIAAGKKKDTDIESLNNNSGIQDATITKAEDIRQTAVDDINTSETETQPELGEQLNVMKELRKNALDKLLKKHPAIKMILKVVKGFGGLTSMIRFFLMGATMTLIYASLAVLALLVIFKLFGPQIKEAFWASWEIMKQFGGLIWSGLDTVWKGVGKIWGAFFGGGSMSDAIDGIILIWFGLLKIVWGIILTILAGLLVFLGVLAWESWLRMKAYFTDSVSSVKKFSKMLVLILAIIVFIALLFTTAPVWLAVVIGLAIWRIGDYIVDKFSGWFGGGKAEGGVTDGRMNLVGEKGPELITLPKGTTVHSNTDSKKMLAETNSSNSTITNVVHNHNYNFKIDAKQTDDNELRRIADKVGKLINTQITRAYGTR